MRSMRVISAKKTPIDEGMVASAAFELTVPPELCNPMDRMHGGAMVRDQTVKWRQATRFADVSVVQC